MITLDVEMRDKNVNLENLRKTGKIPAVFYGKKVPSTPISIAKKDFLKVWKIAGESSVVTLKNPNISVDVLIHDVDINPITDMPRHADFYVFEKGKKVEVSVPLNFVGVSPAVKDLSGTLIKALHEIKISAEPTDIPHQIEVDISSLIDFNSQILAEAIKLPVSIELKENPNEVIAAIAAPREEKEEEAVPVDLSAIEVEKKGKKEETMNEAPVQETRES